MSAQPSSGTTAWCRRVCALLVIDLARSSQLMAPSAARTEKNYQFCNDLLPPPLPVCSDGFTQPSCDRVRLPESVSRQHRFLQNGPGKAFGLPGRGSSPSALCPRTWFQHCFEMRLFEDFLSSKSPFERSNDRAHGFLIAELPARSLRCPSSCTCCMSRLMPCCYFIDGRKEPSGHDGECLLICAGQKSSISFSGVCDLVRIVKVRVVVINRNPGVSKIGSRRSWAIIEQKLSMPAVPASEAFLPRAMRKLYLGFASQNFQPCRCKILKFHAVRLAVLGNGHACFEGSRKLWNADVARVDAAFDAPAKLLQSFSDVPMSSGTKSLPS